MNDSPDRRWFDYMTKVIIQKELLPQAEILLK